jgi:hypothetical protein
MRAARSLSHPGIVRVFDLHEHEGRPLLSMELLSGETLAQRIRRGPVPGEEARDILRACCEALAHAHERGIVHRDLKPANIFLTGKGLKLLDFGLARVVGQARLTATNAVMGTPGYIAPEVLRGAQADPRADLYALGATYFEMLTGHAAFASSEVGEVMRAQEGLPPSPRELESGIPPEVDALIRRALEPDPERRFLDVRQLRRALDGAPLPAPADAPPALVAGDRDVLVREASSLFAPRLRALCKALRVRPAWSWYLRGVAAGDVPLVSGIDAGAAAALVRFCRERGLRAREMPPFRPGRWRRLFWRMPATAGAACGLALTAAAGGLLVLLGTVPSFAGLMRTAPFMIGAGYTLFFAPLLGWQLAARGVLPPLRDLPRGPPALWRIVQGIRRRAEDVGRIGASVPAAEHLVASAQRAAEDAVQMAARVMALPDPEAVTLPAGFDAGERDRCIARLLAVAASLDDALAAAATAAAAEKLREADARLREAIRLLPDPASPPESAA